MCGNAAIITYVQQYCTSTRTYSSLEPLVPSAAYLVPGTRYIQAPNRVQKQRYGGLFRAEKLHVSRDYLITRVTSRATPCTCDGEDKEKHSFPIERGSIAKHHPAWNPLCTQKPRKLLCPKPKVMPRFSLGDVGEARWLLSHRWTEARPILPDVAHDSRNQRRVVSLSALSLLSACVRFRRLREVHHK